MKQIFIRSMVSMRCRMQNLSKATTQKEYQKLVFKTDWEHSAILSTFIKLAFAIKTSVLSIFE